MSSLHWQDPEDDGGAQRSAEVIDVAFRIACAQLAVDHAYDLSRALSEALPWLEQEPLAGVHLIHGAASGNGWQKPAPGDSFPPSRRTRLTLRVPVSRDDDVGSLAGQQLQIGEHTLQVGEARVRSLNTSDTLYAHGVLCDRDDEAAFAELVVQGLAELGIRAPRLLPGMLRRFVFPDGERLTRSVLIAGLEPAHSVRLQERGIGAGRLFGCGLFVPYKKIG